MYQVLLVDDEYMILNGLKKIIDWKSLGFQIVATAENAKEGLSVLEQQRIDLVVTDVTMPEINGLEFIEAAQKEQRCLYCHCVHRCAGPAGLRCDGILFLF